MTTILGIIMFGIMFLLGLLILVTIHVPYPDSIVKWFFGLMAIAFSFGGLEY